MRSSSLFILLVGLISHVYTTPQLISFEDGNLGINFAGFRAGIGIGGVLDNSGTSGGLYAVAGTPFGQLAKAGIGGSIDEKGGVLGRVFAGATGGDNLKVSAGLAGSVNDEKSTGGGFAQAQAGERLAFTKMKGETVVHSHANNFQQLDGKPIQGKVITDIDATNEVKPLHPIPINKEDNTKVDVKADIKSPGFKQVYVKQQPQVLEKRIVDTYNRPRRHNFQQKRSLGDHIGSEGEIVPPDVENPVQVSQKRIEINAESTVNDSTDDNKGAHQTTKTNTRVVNYHKNPSFFQDIFNIPISALRAVGNLLSNTASNTKFTVQKSATVEAAETDPISVKRDPSSFSSSNAQISVETPSASKVIDDIFAIPINTLGAVNTFLENNVSGRKNIQVRREGGEPTKVKLGPHARRRANKQVFIVHEAANKEVEQST